MDYINLFVLSFLSSTLLPGGSEVYLIWLINSTQLSPVILLIIATMGNTIGGFSNWVVGYLITNNLLSQFNFQTIQQSKRYSIATSWIKKWGYSILLLSWLPAIGDLLCLVAGIYKLNAYRSIIYILIGKFFRYFILIFIVQGIQL